MFQLCSQLCQLIQTQLVKSHEEVVARYGDQSTAFTHDDIAIEPGEEDQDLEGIMSSVFMSSVERFQRHLVIKLWTSRLFLVFLRFNHP